MKWEVKPATLDDLMKTRPHLRDADIAEGVAAYGCDPLIPLTIGVTEGTAFAVHTDTLDHPILLYGAYVPPGADGSVTAAIWMVATHELEQPGYARQFIRHCRAQVDELNDKHPLLYAYADARNELHIHWMKWCGFLFIKKHEHFGHEGRPFWEVARIKKTCAYS